MVNWFLSKLTIYKFSVEEEEEMSITGKPSMQPLDGESDQEYLQRLILSDYSK